MGLIKAPGFVFRPEFFLFFVFRVFRFSGLLGFSAWTCSVSPVLDLDLVLLLG